MDTRDFARLDPDNPIGTDFHSRVVAGPGAGKTTWLARQIRHIVRTSMRLGAFGRVLCISYTSVAAEELQKRLQDIANRVYVSTIHSFLYENIVKPYVWLVIDEHGQPLVNYRELAGHTENRPSRNRVSKWINDNGLKYLFYPLKLTEELLGDLTWTLDGETCVLQVRDPDRGNNAYSNRSRSFPNDQPELLLQYKKLCWRQGEIHHEDVLYFAYRIVREHQSVLTFISSRFPHVVVDEFQDTNPIQTYILTQMANSGSFVGVIGDPAQSIYSFQDARMSDFTRFQLPGQRDFVIEGNRRSTTSIVRFLNTLRTDRLRQATIRDDEGNAPICFTGSNITESIDSVIRRFREDVGDEAILEVLVRRNADIATLRSHFQRSERPPTNSPWNRLRAINANREHFLRHLVSGVEHASSGEFNNAIRELHRAFQIDRKGQWLRPVRGIVPPKLKQRDMVLKLLGNLLSQKESLATTSLLKLYNELCLDVLKEYGVSLVRVTHGQGKSLLEQLTYADLASNLTSVSNYIQVTPNVRLRTIHSAKGETLEAVLVVFPDEATLRRLLSGGLDDEEDESRVYYVGLSRASDILYMHVPTMSPETRETLVQCGVEVVHLVSTE